MAEYMNILPPMASLVVEAALEPGGFGFLLWVDRDVVALNVLLCAAHKQRAAPASVQRRL